MQLGQILNELAICKDPLFETYDPGRRNLEITDLYNALRKNLACCRIDVSTANKGLARYHYLQDRRIKIPYLPWTMKPFWRRDEVPSLKPQASCYRSHHY